jgi:hypothetical protein
MLHLRHSLLLSFFLLTWCCHVVAQPISAGLQDARTGEPIIYAHIGIIGTSEGTITDENGHFRLSVPDPASPDWIVQLSAVGYQTMQLSLSALRARAVVELEPAEIILPEVTVRDRHRDQLKTKGHYGRSRNVVTGWSGGVSRGGLRAAHIRLPDRAPDALLKKFRFHLAYNGYDSILFRLHFFYPAATAHEPGEMIPLPEDIFLRHGNSAGDIELDLTPWQIIVDQDFFVAVEVVRTYGTCNSGECLLFSAVLMKERTYYRNTSTGQWGWSKLGSPAFEVELLY